MKYLKTLFIFLSLKEAFKPPFRSQYLMFNISLAIHAYNIYFSILPQLTATGEAGQQMAIGPLAALGNNRG